MLGLEKVFGNRSKKSEGKNSSDVSFLSKNKAEKIVFFDKPIEARQKWRSKNKECEVTIVKHNTGSGRYEIVLDDKKMGVMDTLLQSSEELKAFLLAGGYELAPEKGIKLTVVNEEESSKPAVPQTAPEVETPPAQDERSAEEARVIEEYNALNQAIVEILEGKVGVLGANIGELIEKNAALLGEKREEFYSIRDTIIDSINLLVDEENLLTDNLEKSGRNLSVAVLEEKRANHQKLTAFYTELEKLYLLITREIVKEGERTQDREVASVPSTPESAPVIVMTPSHEEVPPEVKGQVIQLDDFRKKDPTDKEKAEAAELQEQKTIALEKIGKEITEALTQFVENVWQGLQAQGTSQRILTKLWKTEILPDLKKRMVTLVQERSQLTPEECGDISDGILEAVSKKK